MKLFNLKFIILSAIFFSSLSSFAVPMTLVLKLKDRVSMKTLAENVQNPEHPRFRKFYTPEEIRHISAPRESQFSQLINRLKSLGFTILNESPTHLWLTVQADHQLVESVFSLGVILNSQFEHSTQLEPMIPADLGLIESVGGMDTTRHSRSHIKLSKFSSANGPNVGISPAVIKTAYGFDPLYQAGLSGKGQHIAIATFAGFHIKNVTLFYEKLGLIPGPTVDQVNFNGTPNYDGLSAMETELDAEFSGMMAPGASVHVFASKTNDDPGELQLFNAILDDNRAKVVNYSWGDCENHVKPQHKSDMGVVFARAVAQGVNILVASGDSGSDSCQDGSLDAEWPAAADNVIAVGGTTFTQGQTQYETAWNGSGGGISHLWDLPKWQQKLGSPYVKRSYPDVAFNADPNPGQAIYTGATTGQEDSWMTVGGTSMASPQWAGFLTLVGEARAKMNKQSLGFLNPIIYNMNESDLKVNFNDVTSGANGAYQASVGWDAVTGFGSMHADSLLKYLVAQ